MLRERIRDLMPQARADLAEMVTFRSVHDAAQFPVAGCDAMVDWLVGAFTDAGLSDVTAHVTADGSKAVTGVRPGPPGAPTVLLYFHHDVQPPLDDAAWLSPPWELVERDGRWFGRGTADDKGSIAVVLTALRALAAENGGDLPVTVRIVGEGSEEQGTGGLEDFVPHHPDLLRADAILVLDSGNVAVGRPTLTTALRGVADLVVTVETARSVLHSGMFGGPAPDALAALVKMLGTLRDDAGNTTIDGLDATGTWAGADYPADRFRADAQILDGVELLGDGAVADMLWARPVVTILGIDCPPVVGSSAAIQPAARARLNLRVPPGTDPADARAKLIDQLTAATPWGARVSFQPGGIGAPFAGSLGGPAFESMGRAMRAAYGRDLETQGQGGSIPLCTVFQETFPDAEIMLLGVCEPECRIHAPNESVHPSEVENMAVVLAAFLQEYAGSPASS
ncbi:dipeptidase [Nakamurella sp.]|uniref:dipeptidase n=1 Tax=Nakamurella sp. TaxID=1869182 RepID=UPI003783FDFB